MLMCPEYKCPTKPTLQQIKDMIKSDCFEKYKKFQINQKVAKDKSLFFCSTANCETILNIKNKKVNNTVECEKCKVLTCFDCKQKAHGTVSCKKNMEQEYGKWVHDNYNIEKCPNCGC